MIIIIDEIMSKEKYWSIIYINNFYLGLYGDSIIESVHSLYIRHVTSNRNLTYVRRKLDSIEVNLSPPLLSSE